LSFVSGVHDEVRRDHAGSVVAHSDKAATARLVAVSRITMLERDFGEREGSGAFMVAKG
jgi:hypothetical protein